MSEETNVYIRDFNGKLTRISVNLNENVKVLIEEYANKKGIPVSGIKLVYQTKILEPEKLMKDYEIKQDCNLQAIARLLGGKSSL